MAQSNVGDFVRHYTGDFSLIARLLEDATIDEDEPARQREGVDVGRVHYAELILKIRSARIRSQPLADIVDVRVDLAVVQDRQLLQSLLHRFLSDLHVVLG